MNSTELVIVAGMALATFLCRYPVMALAGRYTLSPTAQTILSYVGPAVLAAVLGPELFAPDPQHAAPLFLQPRLWAGVAAALVAWRTSNVWLTILTGLLALGLLRYLIA